MSTKTLWVKGREAVLEHLHSPFLRRKVLSLATHKPFGQAEGPYVCNIDLYNILPERLYYKLEANVPSFIHWLK
jgi:hypothetical protein